MDGLGSQGRSGPGGARKSKVRIRSGLAVAEEARKGNERNSQGRQSWNVVARSI